MLAVGVGGEDVAAGRIEPEADDLTTVGPAGGEYTSEAAVSGDVDGVLIATATERHVSYGAGQVVLAGLRSAQPDAGGPDEQHRGALG